MRVPANWRKAAPRAAALLLLLPILPAGYLAVRLGSAAWSVGGMLKDPAGRMQGDPIVSRIAGAPGPEEREDRLARAARLSPLDFRFPFRLGRDLWGRREEPDGDAALLRAQVVFSEAAALAPTYAPCRLHLFWTALDLGETEAADAEARAALELAPMHPVIRRKVSRYFLERHRLTGDVEDLRTAFRAVMPEDEELVLAFLDDPLLTYERFREGADASRFEPEELLDLLAKADRWSWAVRVAREMDRGAATGRRAGRVLLRHGTYLLSLGASETAHERLEAARELMGPDFDGWLALGRARLAVGLTAEAVDAFGRALAGGTKASLVGDALSETELDADRAVAFWAEHAGGDAPPGVRLEYGRALVRAGREAEAAKVLGDLVDDPRTGAQAHYLLARTFLAAGSPRIALQHCREAVRMAPDRPEYRKLLEELGKADR